MNAQWDIFIAHAGDDREVAEALYDLLHQDARVFLDTRSLRLGDDWDRELAAAQRKSRITVVLVSERTEGAYYQREEIAAAIAMARGNETTHRVVPVFLTASAREAASVPYGLRLKHGLTISRTLTLSGAAARITELCRQLGIQHTARTTLIGSEKLLHLEERIPTALTHLRDFMRSRSLPRIAFEVATNELQTGLNWTRPEARAVAEILIDRKLLLRATGNRVELSQAALQIVTRK